MAGVRNVRNLTCALVIAISVAVATVGPIGIAQADAPAPALTIAGPTAPVTQGGPVAISGRLTIGDVPVAGSPVQLQSHPMGGN